MEFNDTAGVFAVDGSFDQLQKKSNGRRWIQHWVPQDTILGSGKCYLLKWITEDVLNLLNTKDAADVEKEDGSEHEVVYLCSFEGCGKVFPEASGLRKHGHVHGEKQFICHYEGCGKRFVDSSKLKRHFLIHTGEKHFICPFEGCGKAFSLDFNLRSHMRTHTGENYHQCPHEECGKRYAHEYKLRAHMRLHHEQAFSEQRLSSPQVEPERERERDQERDREMATPKLIVPTSIMDKPFGCPYDGCHKRYIHEYKLNLHLRSAHVMDGYEEDAQPNRGSDGEDDIAEGSDQEVAPREVVVRDMIPREIAPRKRGGPRGSGKGKLRIMAKPNSRVAKRKRGNKLPVDLTLKLQATSGSVGRSAGMGHKVLEDSEETEDEGREDTEEEANVHQVGQAPADDDEETEDDMD